MRIAGGVALGTLAASRWWHPALAHAQGRVTRPVIPRRPLGKTGMSVTIVGLGGEGVLRTWGREREAGRVIERALDLGITYYDTAPAYSGSQDYYGAVLGERREGIFLASKTHDRSRDGSLRLLDESLKRLRTDHLDLWQLHDLRDAEDLQHIFAPKTGALAALQQAQADGRVRFLGITGHTDPAVLVEALRRFAFDTVLVALNAADKARLSFIEEVLPVAQRQQMGVIGMKVVARGALLRPVGPLTAPEAIQYVLSLPGVSTAILGCRTPQEVDDNVRIATAFQPLSAEQLAALEGRALPFAPIATTFKRS
ncbi:MAG: aldo/keto reductase [Armatimonadetes bacterium]|nr:aldo/keto reductase [Armatimonadota bacterium]